MYRYWLPAGSGSSSSSSSGGAFTPFDRGHLLRYVVQPEAYARLAADPNVSNPLTASNALVAQYADFYYEYDHERRVTLEMVQGGSRTYEFEYAQSAFDDDYNAWKYKTIETMPGGKQQIV